MWVEKKSREQAYQNTSSSNQKYQQQMTPRQKNRPNVPLPNKNNLTPSRIEERYSTSPLRAPLQSAINRIGRDKSTQRQSRSRVMQKSSRRQDSAIFRKGLFQQQQPLQNNLQAHTETINFIRKYFDFDNPIPIQQFIDRIFYQYKSLWSNVDLRQIIDPFTYKISEIFGTDNIEPNDLAAVTMEDGIIGLILQIFKSITENDSRYDRTDKSERNDRSQRSDRTVIYTAFSKSPNLMSINRSFQQQLSQCANTQNLKNIIQQFMQSMYLQMQKQIYEKFNVQMKRVTVKYREAEKILKKIQQKLIMNADFYEAQQKWGKKLKMMQQNVNELKRRSQKCQDDLQKQKENSSQLKNMKEKIQLQNQKLKENIDKLQQLLFNKFQNSNYSSENSIPSAINLPLSRKLTAPLMDRTHQFINNTSAVSINESKPMQIKIDTQFIQRDNAPPITQTTTTFMQPNYMPLNVYPSTISNGYGQSSNYSNNMSHSPIKRNVEMIQSNRPSFEGSTIKPGTKIGQYTYIPYQSRLSRPF